MGSACQRKGREGKEQYRESPYTGFSHPSAVNAGLSEVSSSTTVSLPDLHIFSNISPSVKNIKVQKNKFHNQLPRSSSTSSIRNTVSSSALIVSDSLPTSPKLASTPKSINLKMKPKCEKPVIEHEYYKPELAEWTLQHVVSDDILKAVGILHV